jgi:Mrp family chromosome partitioning ATPase
MGKIYEALQQAQRERMGGENQDLHGDSGEPRKKHPEFGMEREMALLYQNIDSLLHDSPRKVIQFVAAREAEGTSTVVREFARISALMLGKSVFLMDADRPAPTSETFAEGDPGDGGGSGRMDLVAFEKAISGVDRSRTSVCLISQKSVFLQKYFYSAEIENFWENLRQQFELVLIDSPSLAASPDGIAISRRVDGVVLVVEAEKTRWPVAENLKEQIRRNGGNILGVVFNKRRFYIPEFLYKWI